MSTDSIRLSVNTVNVTVRSSGERVVVSSPRVEIVTAGKLGPPGKNADATFEWATQSFDLEDSQQEFLFDSQPREGSVFVYLNGLLERFWSITGMTLTLGDSALEGDAVTVRYQKET